MIRTLNKRTGRGFTLVELLIVILLIGILMAFALPRFLGNRDKAADRAAQQTLQAAMGTANVPFADSEDYTKSTHVDLNKIEKDIEFVAGNQELANDETSQNRKVSVAADDEQLVLAARGSDASCWFVVLTARDTTRFGQKAINGTGCSADAMTVADADARSWGGVTVQERTS